MKTRALALMLLAAVGAFGLMGSSAAAAKKGRVATGVITVKRQISLNIQNLGPDTSRYYGTITQASAVIEEVATAKVRPKFKIADAAAKATVRRAPRKKQVKAGRKVEEFCHQLTKSSQNPVRVAHVPAPPAQPFEIGISPVDLFFGYSVTGVRAPRNDVIRARQSGKDIAAGNTTFNTGPWQWTGNCGPELEALTLMP